MKNVPLHVAVADRSEDKLIVEGNRTFPDQGSRATRPRGTLAIALPAAALGAVALGAVAIGALAIGRLAVKSARIGRLEIDELIVRDQRKSR